MVRHQLESYNYFLKTKIPNFIRDYNNSPKSSLIIQLDREENRQISIFIGGRDASKLKYVPPADEGNSAVLPHMCRLNNTTYALELRADILVEYTIGTEVIPIMFNDILVARIPLMLKSSLCYLSGMTSEELYEAGECKFELGGYFIIGGGEKILLTQESQGANMFYASKRKVKAEEESLLTSRTEVGEAAGEVEGATKADRDEYIAAVRSVNESGSVGPFSHFLIIPPKNVKPDDSRKIAKSIDYADFTTRRLALITLPGFKNAVPLFSVFKALGITTHQDIYNIILFGISEEQRVMYDEIFAELIISHEKYVKKELDKEEKKDQDADMLVLKKQTRVGTQSAVYMNLYNDMFPHCEKLPEDTAASFYRRKAYLLGMMTRMAVDVAIEITPKTDREHYRFKRLEASGELMFAEFRRIYKDTMNTMKRLLDERVFYERQNYSGRKIANVIRGNMHDYWKSYFFIGEFEKSFKGLWNKKAGVSQELMRFSYLGTIAHLRRVYVDVNKDTKVLDIRRIHGSSWGLLCPCDNPDGREVGLVKSLSLFSQLSTAFPSEIIRKMVYDFKYFIPLVKINPSSWNPRWTKVTLNSDILGAFTNKTDDFHSEILEKRRSRQIQKDVSFRWDRFLNEYIISADAGRPIRPLYREGVSEDKVKRIKDWKKMDTDIIDYIDAEESESMMIAMNPFSAEFLSEIHGSFLFSASASVTPNSDYNQNVRNFFACQQLKQAASWYNTAFNKRYDTFATWLNYAQQPLSQTWTYRHITGCIGYGENPIVALMVYSGYNQEDSIILNKGSLNRGMFNTTYYHSYDFAEEIISFAEQTHTDFGNVATNAKYRETVIRKQDVIYDYLDDDGVIKPGSPVTDKTALVGMVTAVRDLNRQIIGYNDKTKVPKRAQKGVVESVYRYTTVDGLQGVKIRIAEHRLPVIGDKFSARHGQKGTCGITIPEEDMPFTAAGLRPDMIVNPHAFPSRMTIGQFVETMSTKLGVHLGKIVDSTPFSSTKRVEEIRETMIKAGFHPYGHEYMYNGQSGEMIQTEIFMGPTYYIRSKIMVDDKINYRTTGPKTMLTHQPTEGRADGGGLRIGEMERDIIIAHGMSKFMNESSMERSDGTHILFQPEDGYFDSNDTLLTTSMRAPYALGLFLKELEAMHISARLASP
jgi:DNA-directed RNA polymerase II subunit RPB2